MDAPTTVFRFGPFDLDLRTGERRKTGQMVHLPPQPFKVLALLVRRRGDVVTRDDIHKEIWNEATFVDFDQGLNFCIRRIRAPRTCCSASRLGVGSRGDAGPVSSLPIDRLGVTESREGMSARPPSGPRPTFRSPEPRQAAR